MLDSKDPSKIKGKNYKWQALTTKNIDWNPMDIFKHTFSNTILRQRRNGPSFIYFGFIMKVFFCTLDILWQATSLFRLSLESKQRLQFFCSTAAIIFAIEQTLMYGLISSSCAWLLSDNSLLCKSLVKVKRLLEHYERLSATTLSCFFWLDAAWICARAERPVINETKRNYTCNKLPATIWDKPRFSD